MPDAGLRFARREHGLDRADSGGAEQHNLASPSMFSGGIAVADKRIKTTADVAETSMATLAHVSTIACQGPGKCPNGLNRQVLSTCLGQHAKR